ncbi:FAD-dependent monooxygenase [Streptomyces violascens]|uniref:FAD-dependent oxidoreductase n=1 Tax=Streptomyces violascens TaxID=67381 RepID=A0ABQ3QXM5_9ACTN|nr:FAD-dependent monooxygenase [Streptomyces violascens]GGU17917.1 FAD-dependent oxidoreductase [Streptomyces violascens]GHI42038.1 FAD-dependent oxidoreductase [Streptomyces violascens]
MKAVICGAGIAGLALAGRLHNVLGWQVTVLETSPAPRAEGYLVDVFGPGYDAAEVMGVLPWLRELSQPVTRTAFVDESGRCTASLTYDRLARSAGGRLLSIMRSDLELALRERLSFAVDLRFGTGPARIEDRGDGVRVTLTDGSTLDADLLVGADGIHSTVRALIFGDERRYVRDLGLSAAAFTIEDPVLHAELGDRLVLTDMVGRQLGLYAVRDGNVAVLAVHRATHPEPPADTRSALRESFQGIGWMVPRVLERCPPARELYCDQVAQVEMGTWSRGRVVLAGDACHAVSPLSRQGASLGITGAYILADQLGHADSVEEALRHYERIWRPVVSRGQRAARGGARWVVPDSSLRLRVRRAALELAGLPGASRLTGARLAAQRLPALDELATAAP